MQVTKYTTFTTKSQYIEQSAKRIFRATSCTVSHSVRLWRIMMAIYNHTIFCAKYNYTAALYTRFTTYYIGVYIMHSKLVVV